MGTNITARGYRYPDGIEPPALDILLGHLAQDIDADVSDVVAAISGHDAPWTKLPAGAFGSFYTGYVDAGQGYDGVWYRRRTGFVELTGAVTRSGSPVANEIVLTLPAGFRPGRLVQAAVATGAFYIKPNGQLIHSVISSQMSFSAVFEAEQ